MLRFLPPRSFTDFTVPVRSDGSPLTSCTRDEDYEYYIQWLAIYLYQTELILPPLQEAWLHAQCPNPERVLFECSDSLGYALMDLELINQQFEAGHDFYAYQSFMREAWTASEAVETFEEWFDCDEKLWNRLKSEWEQEESAAVEWSHADIPFRPLLGWALKQMPEPDKRVEAMDRYFQNFCDTAGK